MNNTLVGEYRDQVVASALGWVINDHYDQELTYTNQWAEKLLIPTHMLLSRSAMCGRDPVKLASIFRVHPQRIDARLAQEIPQYKRKY